MIEFDNVCVRAGDFELRNVSFRVDTGVYSALMGETGSGKTTILECLCGLRRVQSGRILLTDHDVTAWRPAERSIGYVPQDGALFHTMTVAEHLMFPIRLRGWTTARMQRRIRHLAALLGISHLLDRYPAGLSGGESQRVALGRALSFEPRILVLDEPLSALDDETRERMYALINQVRALVSVTALHVTHSDHEARRLADCIYEIKNGQVIKSDSFGKAKSNVEAQNPE